LLLVTLYGNIHIPKGKQEEENMERREIIFSYNNTRCHAMIVKELFGDERYIGEMDGFEIWQIKGGLFDQFGFVAIEKK
jgi:hypothetical protein